MPELPEVETVMRGITPHIVHRKITAVECRRKDLRIPIPRDFVKRVRGQRVESITRRAKYLLWKLESGESIVVHLGMSGTLVFRCKDRTEARTHDHVVFTFDNGRKLVFHDPRRFGLITLTQNMEKDPLFAHLGPEPLLKKFTATYLQAALAGKKTSIKTAIMDQRVVVGVGNIYASEGLHLAGISPLRPANSLKREEYQALAKALRETLQAAIQSGGSTLRDYVRSSGDAGYFQHQFRVYGREGKPCLCAAKHGILRSTPLVKKIVQQGRATYYCSTCQQ